ncbi:PAS domain-containing protein [Hymenobacter tenuis]
MNSAFPGSDLQALLSVFTVLPGAYLLLSPELIIKAVSNDYLAATASRREQLLGRPMFEAFPDNPMVPEANAVANLRSSLLQVLSTGQPHEMPLQRYDVQDHDNPGAFLERFWLPRNVPVSDEQGKVLLVLHYVVNVTEQVQAQQQVQHLNQELYTANRNLKTNNTQRQELDTELIHTQHQLQQLTQGLDAKVRERTLALEQVQQQVERQRQRLEELFLQAPAAICILDGSALVFELVNPGYQQLFPGRELLGKPLLEALPELEHHEVYRTFRQVYETGNTHQELSMLVPLLRATDGVLEERYFNYIQQARYNEQGQIDGILVFAFEITEQVVAQQQQQQARQISEATTRRLQLLTDALPVLISYIDQSETYQFANEAYESWFHVPAKQIIGQQVRAVIGEAAYQKIQSYMQRALAGERLDFTSLMPYRQDFVRYIQTSYVPDMRDGAVMGFYSLVADITDQVEAREQVQTLNRELQASNEELRANHAQLAQTQQALLEVAQRQARERETFYQVFEQTPACIALLRGPEHTFEYINAAYQQLFPGRQLLGLPVTVALPEIVGQGFDVFIDRVYHTGETFFGTELPLTVQHSNGLAPQHMYFTFTYQAYREEGSVAGVSIFAHDVTEQVLARQQRETQQQRLHSLFMQAPAGICILDGPDLVYEFVNPGYEQLIPGRSFLGMPILEAMPEIAGTHIERLLQKVYRTGQTHEEQAMLVPIARPFDGVLEDRYFSFVYQARHDDQEQINGVLVFAFEVTEQVEARRAAESSAQQAHALATALSTTNEKLTRTNVDLDNFIYTASHDLKAPITNIEGLLHTLQAEMPPQSQAGEVSYILDLMQDSVERFKKTIDHLTDVSKLQKEHDQPAYEVPLAHVIEEVRLDLAPLLQEVGARMSVDVRAVPRVMFPEKNLRSVVYNLLSNALKYHHPDRSVKVQVRARVEPDFYVLEVQDNGLGLDLSRERQLFGMFQRFHTHVEGSGVGLYMVKRMIENAGGHIQVQSELGTGSTFSVYFPR